MAGPTDPNLGRVLKGTYRIERLLGRGGMGAVYEARHTKLSKRFAVKLLLPELDLTSTLRERFFREAEACSRIDHDNVVDIIDFDEAPEGELFMVMEILEGEDLAGRLRSGKPVAPDSLVTWFVETCDAVAAAHDLGIVHRDLKPANIFLQRRGDREVVKVLDFGLAKFRAEAGLTTSGTLMGTPCYMAPEQIEGDTEAVGPQADVFALGCILYELLVGQVAFSGRSIAQIAYQIVHGRRPALPPDRYPALQPLLDTCLAQDPAARPADVAMLRAQFLEIVAQMPELPLPAVRTGVTRYLGDGLGSGDETLPATPGRAPTRGPVDSGGPGAVGELETLMHDSGDGAGGLDPTVAAPGASAKETRPLGRRPGGAPAGAEPGAQGGTAAAPPPGQEVSEDEDPPDASQYTTVGRLRHRRGTLALLGLVTAGVIALAVLLPRLTPHRPAAGRRGAAEETLPPWAQGVPRDAQPALRRLDQPAEWHRLTLAHWRGLAEALEQAHQRANLPPGPLQRLQTRMYLARALEHLLAGRPQQATELAGQAVRKAEHAQEPAAQTLAALGSAWIWLQRDAPDEARDRLRSAPNTSAHALGLRAAADLQVGDVATALAGARRATTLAPGDPVPWLVLSQAATARGDPLEAERAAAEALAAAPGWPAARIRMALLLGKAAAGRPGARSLCATRPTDAPLYLGALARCRARLRLTSAQEQPDQFHRARALAGLLPTLKADGLRGTGAALVGLAPLPPALLRRLAKLVAGTAEDPPLPRALRLGAAVALREQRLDAAAALVKAATRSARWPHRVHMLQGELALRQGHLPQAVRHYEEAARAALRAGIGEPPRPGRKPSSPGACDRRAPAPSDHVVIQERLVTLRRARAQAPQGAAPARPHRIALSALSAAVGEELWR